MNDDDDVVRIETVGKRRVYSEAEYDALRKHAESLHEAGEAFSAMIGMGNMPTEKLYRRVITAQAALEAYRAAYPKEDSDADKRTT